MLLVLLLTRRATLALRHLADRLRLTYLSLGAAAWPASGHRREDWHLTPMVLWAFGAGLTAAAVTVGAWYLLRGPKESGGRRSPHVPVLVASVVFSLTLGSLMVWNLVAAA
ncbi:hypothetical protein CQJ94_07105 [Glycomyces fuscus]|nr:hypothetical protein CQJ94_07105 [Glycomyces fuscus]